MPTPDSPSLDYSFTAFQEGQGTNDFPGTQLDAALANLKQSIDQLIDFTGAVIRDDEQLNNGIVTKNALAADVRTGLPAPRPWATATDYAVDDTATTNNGLYICLVEHTSGVFATDLAAGFWQVLATWAPLTEVSDGTVSTAKIVDGAVTGPKLAAAAVTEAKIADAAVTKAKLAAAVQALLLPVGMEGDFSGPFAPSGWLFKDGRALSRVTYAALMDVICPSVVGAVTSGSQSVTGLAVDLRGLGLEGSSIEGVGVPAGATIASVTQTTLTLSVNATATNASVSLRLFPNGNGDGSSTFNIPDDKGRGSIGRDNMGGTAAGRVTASGTGNPGLNGSRLGAAGGADRVTLTTAQLASHTHTAVVTDPGHVHTEIQSTDSGFDLAGGINGNVYIPVNGNTGSAVTGISVANDAAGSGEAHPNLPPSRITNKIIFTGVL